MAEGAGFAYFLSPVGVVVVFFSFFLLLLVADVEGLFVFLFDCLVCVFAFFMVLRESYSFFF